MPVFYVKCGLMYICRIHFHLVESTGQIEGGEILTFTKLIQYIRYIWNWVLVVNRLLIYFPKVHDKPPLNFTRCVCLFGNDPNRRAPRRFRRSNYILCKHFFYLVSDLLSVDVGITVTFCVCRNFISGSYLMFYLVGESL